MTRALSRFAILLLVMMLSACSDRPAGKVIDEAIAALTEARTLEGVFAVKQVRKTNGYLLDNFYHVEFSYDRVCLVGIDEAIAVLDRQAAAEKSTSVADGLVKGLYVLASKSGMVKLALREEYGNFKKGDVFHEKVTVKFLKTENGWQRHSDL